MDRYLLSGAFCLLIIEVTVLLADLGKIDIGWQPFAPQRIHQSEIGEVVFAKQNVRRRSQESIVWENTGNNDKLYSYDSVLTLSQSSAKIELDGDIQIQLHENTLVVLEPIENQTEDEFRLKFSRGNLRSKNSRRFKVGSGDWTIEAKPKTDISLRSLDDENIEVEVHQGDIQLENKNNKDQNQKVSSGHRLKLSKEEVEEKKSLSSAVKWHFEKDQRVYSHSFPVTFELKWDGPAERLRMLTPDKKVIYIPVANSQNRHSLILEKGTYYFSLENQESISSSLGVHVWPAPKVRYYSPLPRDRIDASESGTYSWSKMEPADKYFVQFSPFRDFSIIMNSISATKNISKAQLHPGQYYWRVEGQDEEGFRIPALYANPVFSVSDPLLAPKLRKPASTPHSKKPKKNLKKKNLLKNKGARLFDKFWQLLLPKAAADESSLYKRKIVFSWFPVPDADFYIIEISEKPDFQNPQVIQKVPIESYEWLNFAKQSYYWRVAAGKKDGRMGLFSEAAHVDLSKLSDLNMGELSTGVRYEVAKAKPQPQPPPQPKAKPKPAPNVKKVRPFLPEDLNRMFRIWWGLSHNFATLSNDEISSVQLTGVTPVNLAGSFNLPKKQKGSILVEWVAVSSEWSNDHDDLPLQEDFTDATGQVDVLWRQPKEHWAFGFSLAKVSVPLRINLESVELLGEYLLGGAAARYFAINKHWVYHLKLALQTNGNLFGFSNHNRFVRKLKVEWGAAQPFVGGQIDVNVLTGSESISGFSNQTGLMIGVNW